MTAMVRVSIATLTAAFALTGVQPALGQSAPVSQSEIHCFVSGCDEAAEAPAPQANASADAAGGDDPCMTTGVCPAGETKGFHLSGAVPAKSAATRPNTPASSRPSYVNTSSAARMGGAGRRTTQALPATRRALDMRLSFEKSSSELTLDARQQADVFARELMGAAGSRQFVIEGHTDSKGPAAFNRSLSRARAQAVVEYLVSKGVPQSKLRAVGYGSDHPRDGTAATDPSNRRVEIVRY
jgi:outer membrane protein OmpA-like peptidoglycan-associated protein